MNDPAPSIPPSLPRINDLAPDFDVHTTLGRRRLQDYAGRWLVLFSHPADFTPVCTSEFVAFAKSHAAFAALDCDLLGLSVDSVFSHIAWLREIERAFDVPIPFPVIEDAQQKLAIRYGMVHPAESDTSAVRATFVIDPDGVVRAIIYYPMTTGRSVDEILRLVQALRATTERRVATPEGWRPGANTLELPADTATAAARGGESADPTWFYRPRRP